MRIRTKIAVKSFDNATYPVGTVGECIQKTSTGGYSYLEIRLTDPFGNPFIQTFGHGDAFHHFFEILPEDADQ